MGKFGVVRPVGEAMCSLFASKNTFRTSSYKNRRTCRFFNRTFYWFSNGIIKYNHIQLQYNLQCLSWCKGRKKDDKLAFQKHAIRLQEAFAPRRNKPKLLMWTAVEATEIKH